MRLGRSIVLIRDSLLALTRLGRLLRARGGEAVADDDDLVDGEADGVSPALQSDRGGARDVSELIRAGRVADAREHLHQWRKQYLRARRSAVEATLRRIALEEGETEQYHACIQLLSETEGCAITEGLAQRAHGSRIPLNDVASFRHAMAISTRRAQLHGAGPEWRLNDKRRGYRFVREFQIAHPEVHQTGVPLKRLEPRHSVVVKPASGSSARGVYMVLGDGRVFQPSGGRWFRNWKAMIRALRNDLDDRRVKADAWVVEDLVTEDGEGLQPGRDLKFYCFFGQVGLVLEVMRIGEVAYCEWQAPGEMVFSGKYDKKRFQGDGPTEEQMAMVAELSARIPAPFMRIDFIRSATAPYGLSFCEFTPRPGAFHRFNRAFDRQLGEQYLAAEGRLQDALLTGRRFHKLFRQGRKPRSNMGN